MVTKGMFWKRFYFVVILLSCNCFLLCSNWFCEFVKKLCGCEQPEKIDYEQGGNLNNNINNNINLGDTVDNDTDENTIIYKCVFLSSTIYVGKSAILNYIINKKFNENYETTMGFEFFSRSYGEEGSKVKIAIKIWDCSAEERFNGMITPVLRSSHAIVFVYDITTRKSFDNLQGYITDVKEKAPKDCLFFLLGNKLDLKEERKVTTEEAQQLAADNDLIFLGECSVKTNTYIPAKGLYCEQNDLVDEERKCTESLNGMLKDITCHIYKPQKITQGTSQIKLIEIEPKN